MRHHRGKQTTETDAQTGTPYAHGKLSLDAEIIKLNFHRDVIEANHRLPVLVDFYATCCGPSNMLGPVLDEVVKKTPGPLKLVKVNTDTVGFNPDG